MERPITAPSVLLNSAIEFNLYDTSHKISWGRRRGRRKGIFFGRLPLPMEIFFLLYVFSQIFCSLIYRMCHLCIGYVYVNSFFICSVRYVYLAPNMVIELEGQPLKITDEHCPSPFSLSTSES